ncbi:MAG TPA: tRNA-dihydrouridine synthase [Solirubrobacterales bacterium]|nr:tRNA-dihydrouridine synthase [Solirubrobacterales bacterium]
MGPAPQLTDPLELPCGLVLANRLGRAAMTEALSDRRNDPTRRHDRLYGSNANGGAGLVLTGNVMIDRRHLERARNIVVDAATDAAALRRCAASAAAAPTLVQLSHPGRQVNRYVQPHPVSPSGGPGLKLAGAFAAPRALSRPEIDEVRARFVDAATRVVDAGFPGIQIHGAHGYLISSFIDPARNRREDEYGGDLDGRARLLLEIVAELREALPAAAPVAVKLDARDGAEAELAELGIRLERAGIDLIEVSGGNYERPAMAGYEADGSEISSEHESPFWNAAAALSAAVSVPVMLTGGFRTRTEVDRALAAGVCDIVGAGRPLAVRPELAGRFVRGETDVLDPPGPRLGGPAPVRQLLGAAAGTGWHRIQLARTGAGRPPSLRIPALLAAFDYTAVDWAQAVLARPARMVLAGRTPAPGPNT